MREMRNSSEINQAGAEREGAAVEVAFRKAEEKVNKDRIDVGSFRDLYGSADIEADKRRVMDVRAGIARENDPQRMLLRKYATIFEWIINDGIELDEYFGENAFTKKTSEYDDLVNKVDIIVEFHDQEEGRQASYLAVGVDGTFSSSQETQAKKFLEIKREIDRGELGRIKYFVSDYVGFRGELRAPDLFSEQVLVW